MKPEWRFTSDDEISVCAAFEDGHCESHSINADLIQAWLAEGNTPLPYAPDPAAAQAALKEALKASAQSALDKSDTTLLRCYEAGVAVPVEWATYRGQLREIVSGKSSATVLPVRPVYPV